LISALLAVSAGTVSVGSARAADEADASALAPPPPAPFRRGPLVEGSVGVYAPTGRFAQIAAPGPWTRIAAGWDFARYFGMFVAADAAFLSTGRAPPPPGDRAFVFWGFSGGFRASLGLGERFRIPIRAEIGMHRAEDTGVLAVYGYGVARDFAVSYGGTLGLEWRAVSRHYGVVLEGGVRNDAALAYAGGASSTLAILASLGIHYTL
jgi:hypothetical protein